MIWSDVRNQMVDEQIESRGVRTPKVTRAMRTVPREAFVPEKLRSSAYEDSALPIEEGQTISQPFIVAFMIDALELEPTDRVLEVGTGSGYATAVMSRIVRWVFGMERHASLVDLARGRLERLGYKNVTLGLGDGSAGWRDAAPFDAILVSACDREISEALLAQLRVGGRLVMPIEEAGGEQELIRVRRMGDLEYQYSSLGAVEFVPLVKGEAPKSC